MPVSQYRTRSIFISFHFAPIYPLLTIEPISICLKSSKFVTEISHLIQPLKRLPLSCRQYDVKRRVTRPTRNVALMAAFYRRRRLRHLAFSFISFILLKKLVKKYEELSSSLHDKLLHITREKAELVEKTRYMPLETHVGRNSCKS